MGQHGTTRGTGDDLNHIWIRWLHNTFRVHLKGGTGDWGQWGQLDVQETT